MKKRGSYTIEAAVVVPLLFLVVWLVIYIGCFLYNREAMTVIASRAVLKGVQMEQEGKQTIEKQVNAFVKEETKSRLIFPEKICHQVTVTGTKVKVTLYLTQKMPFKTINCEVTKEMSRIYPVSFLWEKERLKGKE